MSASPRTPPGRPGSGLHAALTPRHAADFAPLHGTRIVSLALNLPGPAALARLHALGAQALKIEPPAGDPMRAMCAPLYRAMHRGIARRRVDLKSEAGRDALMGELDRADLFLTSFRPSALRRLGLDPQTLAARLPRLSTVAIVGARGRAAEEPGHDLTYQASAGLIDAPRPPATLLADMCGALLAVEAALGALLQASRVGRGVALQVALADAAAFAAVPRSAGLTAPGELLAGALPGYAVYRCRDGLVALAALEPHFATALQQQAGALTGRALRAWCAARDTAALHALARRHDLPLWAWKTGTD